MTKKRENLVFNPDFAFSLFCATIIEETQEIPSMSREYAEDRIREALKLAKGNPTKARQQVIAWAAEDQRLLWALTQPHLTGVVAHAINRVIYRQGIEQEAEEIPAKPKALNLAPETFGKQILNALSSHDTAVFGLEGNAAPSRQKKASQSHIDALKKIAGKVKKKD
jgi:hypothetical protein